MKKERRFRLAMVVVFSVAAGVAVAEGIAHRRSINEYNEVIRQSDLVINRLRTTRKLHATLLAAETGQRGYLLIR
ncbi:MAG: hypothetical protein HQL77_16130 [Magnetococcales bacterium]|nr:hypothetical protein [Magnetococcales bacterium]